MTQRKLAIVPERIGGASLNQELRNLRSAVAAHMGFDEKGAKGITLCHSDIGGLAVSFIIRGHDEARDAEARLRSLPGYNVTKTERTPDGMRRCVKGYIE